MDFEHHLYLRCHYQNEVDDRMHVVDDVPICRRRTVGRVRAVLIQVLSNDDIKKMTV